LIKHFVQEIDRLNKEIIAERERERERAKLTRMTAENLELLVVV
jgi:hypothetical protein